MGEAKRRKQLDPNWAKEKKVTITPASVEDIDVESLDSCDLVEDLFLPVHVHTEKRTYTILSSGFHRDKQQKHFNIYWNRLIPPDQKKDWDREISQDKYKFDLLGRALLDYGFTIMGTTVKAVEIWEEKDYIKYSYVDWDIPKLD